MIVQCKLEKSDIFLKRIFFHFAESTNSLYFRSYKNTKSTNFAIDYHSYLQTNFQLICFFGDVCPPTKTIRPFNHFSKQNPKLRPISPNDFQVIATLPMNRPYLVYGDICAPPKMGKTIKKIIFYLPNRQCKSKFQGKSDTI